MYVTTMSALAGWEYRPVNRQRSWPHATAERPAGRLVAVAVAVGVARWRLAMCDVRCVMPGGSRRYGVISSEWG
jgi:hypothetical protein